MNSYSRTVAWIVWGFLGAVIIAVGALYFSKRSEGTGGPLPVYGQVSAFALTNQNGQAVSLEALRGHVWVANVIFTRCGGPCPRMTQQMKLLQDALPAGSQAKLVTLTTDPEFDAPPVLKAYATRFGANPDRWSFLTGPQKELNALIVASLKLTALETKPEERNAADDLFIHSTIFVVVDKQAQLRGVFETEGDGVNPAQARRKILAAVRQLEREP